MYNEENWYYMYNELVIYYDKYHSLEVPSDYVTSYGEKLGTWVQSQRRSYKMGTLSEKRIKLLEGIGFRFENKINRVSFKEMTQKVKEYYTEHGDLNIPYRYQTKEGYNLGMWLRNIKSSYRNGKLSDDRIKELEIIGVNFNLKKHNAWNSMYKKAKEYYKEHGNLEVPKRYQTSDGYSLGTWVISQRTKKDKLSKSQIKRLEKIGMRFEKKDISWEEKYQIAKVYYEEHHDLEVSNDYVTADGYPLGNWIRTQRSAYRDGELSEERKELLNKIGMRFGYIRPYWNEMYMAAKAYYEEHKNLDIPQDYVTPEGYELGSWLKIQKSFYRTGQIDGERALLLSEIGMQFTTRASSWMATYMVAKAYYEKYGNLCIPYNYKLENGYCLGSWIINQRTAYKNNKLSDEQINLLEEIGMRFENRLTFIPWMTMYEKAKEYYDTYGNLKIIISYKTADGYSLGNWINNQRMSYRRGELSEDKIIMLDKIGMIWSILQNNHEVEAICTRYGIDADLLKKNISCKELESKINYLLSNNIPLVIDGQIHEIFNMSSSNMEVKYHISLEDIITIYCSKDKDTVIKRKKL